MKLEAFIALVVVGLASYRLTRVIVSDTITASFRVWLWRHAYDDGGYDSLTERNVTTRRSWAWEKLYQLFTCPFCTGWWISLAFYWAWMFADWRWTHHAIAALAATGIQAVISSRPSA